MIEDIFLSIIDFFVNSTFWLVVLYVVLLLLVAWYMIKSWGF
jgi:hypothetical protein